MTGLSLCVILITAFMSSSLVIQQEKGKLVSLFAGFILGVLSGYLLISWALVTTVEILASTVFGPIVRWFFVGIIIFSGLWYIFDAFKEKSR